MALTAGSGVLGCSSRRRPAVGGSAGFQAEIGSSWSKPCWRSRSVKLQAVRHSSIALAPSAGPRHCFPPAPCSRSPAHGRERPKAPKRSRSRKPPPAALPAAARRPICRAPPRPAGPASRYFPERPHPYPLPPPESPGGAGASASASRHERGKSAAPPNSQAAAIGQRRGWFCGRKLLNRQAPRGRCIVPRHRGPPPVIPEARAQAARVAGRWPPHPRATASTPTSRAYAAVTLPATLPRSAAGSARGQFAEAAIMLVAQRTPEILHKTPVPRPRSHGGCHPLLLQRSARAGGPAAAGRCESVPFSSRRPRGA